MNVPTILLEDTRDPQNRALCQMAQEERFVLFSLCYALKPGLLLEIGRARGGSTLILAEALKLNRCGKLVSLDPEDPRWPVNVIDPAVKRSLGDQGVVFVDGYSPAALPEAFATAGGPFDFVLIDGDHSYEGCFADIQGCLPFLNRGSRVLFHDAFYRPVQAAIDDALKAFPVLQDCGLVSCKANLKADEFVEHRGEKYPVIWGGLRLLAHQGA